MIEPRDIIDFKECRAPAMAPARHMPNGGMMLQSASTKALPPDRIFERAMRSVTAAIIRRERAGEEWKRYGGGAGGARELSRPRHRVQSCSYAQRDTTKRYSYE